MPDRSPSTSGRWNTAVPSKVWIDGSSERPVPRRQFRMQLAHERPKPKPSACYAATRARPTALHRREYHREHPGVYQQRWITINRIQVASSIIRGLKKYRPLTQFCRNLRDTAAVRDGLRHSPPVRYALAYCSAHSQRKPTLPARSLRCSGRRRPALTTTPRYRKTEHCDIDAGLDSEAVRRCCPGRTSCQLGKTATECRSRLCLDCLRQRRESAAGCRAR